MIHPDIKNLIELLKQSGYNYPNKEAIQLLISKGASSTQASFAFFQGYQIPLEEVNHALEEYLDLFNDESLEDIVYETFLYDSYDPDDPKFKADGNMIRFPMKKKNI